jgi:uncharacterized protein YjbI with pentapeptide repeats
MSPQVTAAVIAAGVGVLTVIATVAVQISGRRATSRDTQKALEEQRKQLDRTLSEQRTRTLNERFATAAGQLGDDKPPAVRLAGAYAMAGLADDWPENRQTCVDVLCAYLRLPYDPDPGEDADSAEKTAYRANREVRHTVIRLIGSHLRPEAAVSWQGLNFDFTGVVFDGGDFTAARFSSGIVLFDDAKFSGGKISFHSAEFAGSHVSFHSAEFSGSHVSFDEAKFSSSKVSFLVAKVSGGHVSFDRAKFSGGEVDFSTAVFAGGEVDFSIAVFSGGRVGFVGAEFSGGKISFHSAEFAGSLVGFIYAVFSGGRVGFDYAVFSGGRVGFGAAVFSGGHVSFDKAKFSGGTVDFSDPGDWSTPPAFPWTDTSPPGVKLPKKEDQSQE